MGCGNSGRHFRLETIFNYGPGSDQRIEVRLARDSRKWNLAALVAFARVVVCGDTGVAHLATAYGTSSVLLFACMSPARWGPPPGRPWHRVLWHPELAATPASAMALAGAPGVAAGRSAFRAQVAGKRPHPALLAIEVDDVLEALDAVATR